MNGNIQRGDGEIIKAALWFSDLRNYSGMSEQYDKEEIFSLLNTYFQTISDIIGKHHGEILKFIGDAVLVIFPVDEDINSTMACTAALTAAQESFEQFKHQNTERRDQTKPEIQFGIGLHFGQVIFGNVGAIDRLDFTVIGPAVNLTSRLEELTKQTGDPLLISEEFANNLKISSKPVGKFHLKGIQEIQQVFTVI